MNSVNNIVSKLRESRIREDDNQAYQEFIKKCQDNATWKKVNGICNKYGYRLSKDSCVDVLPKGKLISMKIFSDKTNEYLPDIYFDHTRFGKEVMEFKIQTTSYGALTLEEHTKYVEAATSANNLIKDLEGIDFYTLYNDESDY